MIIRPSFTVLGGTAIGLIAGAAVYGTVSTGSASASTSGSVKPATSVVAEPTAAAHCAAGQKLEDGVCVIHVKRTVVVAARSAADGQAPLSSGTADQSQGSAPSASIDQETKDGAQSDDDAMPDAVDEDFSEHSGSTESESTENGSDDSGRDYGPGEAPSDDGSDASHG